MLRTLRVRSAEAGLEAWWPPLAFLITERQLEMTLLKLKLGGCAYYARLFPASLDGQSTTGT